MLHHLHFRKFIQLAKWFIQNQKIKIFIQCSCQCNSLSLSAANIFTVLTYLFCCTSIDKCFKTRNVCSHFKLFFIAIVMQHYILNGSIMNKKRLLLYIRNTIPVTSNRSRFFIDDNSAGIWLQKTKK